METLRVQTKQIEQQYKTPPNRQNRSSQKQRLPYIGQQNSETYNSQSMDIKDYINGLQGRIVSLNQQLKHKKQSLQILKKQSLAYQNMKDNSTKYSNDLGLFKLYQDQSPKQRHQSQIQFCQQNKIKQCSQLIEQQKQSDVEFQQSQRLKFQSLREDQQQYQDINLYQNVQKSNLLNPEQRNGQKKVSKKLQTEVESEKFICEQSTERLEHMNRFLKDECQFQKKTNDQIFKQVENCKIDSQYQKQKRIKSLSTASLLNQGFNEKENIFDNQTILSLIKNSQIQKAQTQKKLKESVQKCNEQIRKAITQNQVLNFSSQSNNLQTESSLAATISENIFNKELTLSQKVKILLNKKSEEQAVKLQEMQKQQQETSLLANEKNKYSLSETQRYYYQPKLIARYQNNKNNSETIQNQRIQNMQTQQFNSSFFLED
ncbi:hypothetical protein ABPG74_021637 [Tetrahymena malaccensis]